MPTNPLSLKQRLAALSNAPSSPSPPYGTDAPKSPSKRKFNAPWARRHSFDHGDGEQASRDRVQDVMNKLIFQAGVDFECVFISRSRKSLLNFYTGQDQCKSLRAHYLNCELNVHFRVVLNASALPDPRDVNYDLLLSCVSHGLKYLIMLNGILLSRRTLAYLNLYGMFALCKARVDAQMML